MPRGEKLHQKYLREEESQIFIQDAWIGGERERKKKAWVIKLIGFLKNALVSDVQHIQVLTRRY